MSEHTGPLEHYEQLLASRYAWMLGELGDRLAHEMAIFERLGLPRAEERGRAIDLGCGTGLHTRMFRELGYHVCAVDQSPTILQALWELEGVEVLLGDLLDVDVSDAHVIGCLGDTLTHLADWQQVEQVLSMWRPGRHLVLSFRDLSVPLEGLQRFFVVRSTSERIHTCFLEDAGTHVRVHDLFHEFDGEAWSLQKGAYLKLRIDPARVIHTLESAGAKVQSDQERGLIRLVAS